MTKYLGSSAAGFGRSGSGGFTLEPRVRNTARTTGKAGGAVDQRGMACALRTCTLLRLCHRHG
eukprot:3530873-Heterocapsa_arctica.AAC.1